MDKKAESMRPFFERIRDLEHESRNRHRTRGDVNGASGLLAVLERHYAMLAGLVLTDLS